MGYLGTRVVITFDVITNLFIKKKKKNSFWKNKKKLGKIKKKN